jgi:hypothetical protein
MVGEGLVGEGARRRTPCAERAVILPAVQSLRLLVRRRHGRRGLVERARRRTPCAERAVILPAVQSLRLLERRGHGRRGLVERARVGALRARREL